MGVLFSPFAQGRTEDAVTAGLAFAGVGHCKQAHRYRNDQVAVTARVDQPLCGHGEHRQRRARDQGHGHLCEGLRLAALKVSSL